MRRPCFPAILNANLHYGTEFAVLDNCHVGVERV